MWQYLFYLIEFIHLKMPKTINTIHKKTLLGLMNKQAEGNVRIVLASFVQNIQLSKALAKSC